MTRRPVSPHAGAGVMRVSPRRVHTAWVCSSWRVRPETSQCTAPILVPAPVGLVGLWIFGRCTSHCLLHLTTELKRISKWGSTATNGGAALEAEPRRTVFHPPGGTHLVRPRRALGDNPDPKEVLMTGIVRLRSGRFVARIQWPGQSGMALYAEDGRYIGLLPFPHSPPTYP